MMVRIARNTVVLSTCASSSDIGIGDGPRSFQSKMIRGRVGRAPDPFQPLTPP